MSKLKTHRGAAKRFRRTATGRIKVRRANRNHILTKKTPKRKRQIRAQLSLKPCDKPAVERLLTGS